MVMNIINYGSMFDIISGDDVSITDRIPALTLKVVQDRSGFHLMRTPISYMLPLVRFMVITLRKSIRFSGVIMLTMITLVSFYPVIRELVRRC